MVEIIVSERMIVMMMITKVIMMMEVGEKEGNEE